MASMITLTAGSKTFAQIDMYHAYPQITLGKSSRFKLLSIYYALLEHSRAQLLQSAASGRLPLLKYRMVQHITTVA